MLLLASVAFQVSEFLAGVKKKKGRQSIPNILLAPVLSSRSILRGDVLRVETYDGPSLNHDEQSATCSWMMQNANQEE
jgi:hypothetical protein